MRIQRRTLARAVFAAASALPLQAQAGMPFDQIIAFGASFEDVGQFPDYDFVAAALPALVAPPGAGLDGSTGLRLTNLDPATGRRGEAWIEMFASDIGVGALAPSTPLLYPGARTDIAPTDNVDFSYAGGMAADLLQAVTGESLVVHPVDYLLPADLTARSPGLLQRVQAGTLSVGPTTLYVVNPAANDVRGVTVEDPTSSSIAGAQTTLEIIRQLAALGARTIVVPTFAPLGELPESVNVNADGSRTELALARTAGAQAYNATMAAGLPGVGANVVVVDWAGLFGEMLAAPASFGFDAAIDHRRYCYTANEWSITNVRCTEAPDLGKSSGGDPDDFIVNDGLHPTQATARILADYTESVLRAPGMASLLPETVLGDARGYLNVVDDYLTQNRFGERAGEPQLFVAVQGQRLDVDETRSTAEASSDATDLAIGGSLGIAPGWFVGAALGAQQGETDFDGSGSSFDSEGLIGSVFAGYRCDGWFADLVLTAGASDLDDIRRVFELGNVLLRSESGDTDADVAGVSATLGVDMTSQAAPWRFGPFLQADYLSIEVEGYAEQGSRSTAMQFDDLERESALGTAGVFASYPWRIGGAELEFYGDAAYAHEFEDDAEQVHAALKSVSSVGWFSMPGYRIDEDGWRARLGLDANWSGGLHAGLSYRYADNDAAAQYVNLAVGYSF